MGWLSQVFIFLADTLKIAAQVNNSNPAKHSTQERYFNKHARRLSQVYSFSESK